MDEMSIIQDRDKAIAKALEDFMTLPAGSPELAKQSEVIERLYKLKLTDDKQYAEADNAEKRLELDKAKANDEAEDRKCRREMEEAKNLADNSAQIYRNTMEENKNLDDKQLAEGQQLIDKIRIGMEIGKIVLILAATGLQQRSIMKFEETGIARSKSWGFLESIKGLIK